MLIPGQAVQFMRGKYNFLGYPRLKGLNCEPEKHNPIFLSRGFTFDLNKNHYYFVTTTIENRRSFVNKHYSLVGYYRFFQV